MFNCCYKKEEDHDYVKMDTECKIINHPISGTHNTMSLDKLKEYLNKRERTITKVVYEIDMDEYDVGDVFFFSHNSDKRLEYKPCRVRSGLYKKTTKNDIQLFYPGIRKADAYIIITKKDEIYIWDVEEDDVMKLNNYNDISFELYWQDIEILT